MPEDYSFISLDATRLHIASHYEHTLPTYDEFVSLLEHYIPDNALTLAVDGVVSAIIMSAINNEGLEEELKKTLKQLLTLAKVNDKAIRQIMARLGILLSKLKNKQ